MAEVSVIGVPDEEWWRNHIRAGCRRAPVSMKALIEAFAKVETMKEGAGFAVSSAGVAPARSTCYSMTAATLSVLCPSPQT